MENEPRKLAKIIMILTGEKIIVNSNVQNIESFLIDSNNIEKLLPTDKVSNFESDENACSLKFKEVLPFHWYKMVKKMEKYILNLERNRLFHLNSRST